MCNSGSFHLETFDRPVSRGDRSNEAVRNMITMHPKLVDRVELGCPVWLFQDFVDIHL